MGRSETRNYVPGGPIAGQPTCTRSCRGGGGIHYDWGVYTMTGRGRGAIRDS